MVLRMSCYLSITVTKYLQQSAYKTERFSKFQSMTDKPCSFGPVAKQQIAAGMHEEESLFSSKLLQKKE